MRNFRIQSVPKPRVTLENHAFSHLDVEIGCGVGLHPVNYALENLNRTLIAVDKSLIRYEKMIQRIANHQEIPNLIPIRENAVWFVTHEITKNSVENYFFLYPNPYPKKGQANKRWHQMPFMQHVIATLKAEGKIHLATNMKFYAEDAEDFFTNFWNLKLIKKETYRSLQEIPFPPRTHFEKKYLERGETCWNFIFQK